METSETIETTDPDPALRPAGWTDYVGQARLKAYLDVLIERAVADDRRLDHLLFDGPAGSGKTTLARVVAGRLGDKLVVLRKPITADRLLNVLDELGAGVLFIDEIHLWRKVQPDLLPLLEDQVFEGRWGSYRFPHVTVIGATTDADQLIGPLYERFQVPPWDAYTTDELADIAAGMGVKLGMDLPDGLCEAIAGAAGGVPRNCRLLVEQARALFVSRGMPSPAELLDFAQVGSDGLTRAHVEYLRVLDILGGQAGIDNVARLMRKPKAMVLELERLLITQRLVALGPGGRQLLPQGRQRGIDVDAPVERLMPRSKRLAAAGRS